LVRALFTCLFCVCFWLGSHCLAYKFSLCYYVKLGQAQELLDQ
jgi:hypothetical protein